MLVDAGSDRRRRLRKLDLCRRRDVRDRGCGLRADPARRRRAEAAPCVSRQAWRSRRVLVACLAAPFMRDQLAQRRGARRRPSDRRDDPFEVLGDMFPQRCAACSICRPIGSFCCRSNFRRSMSRARSRLSWHCAAPRPGMEKTTALVFARAGADRASSSPGCWPARLATTTISSCARSCRRR